MTNSYKKLHYFFESAAKEPAQRRLFIIILFSCLPSAVSAYFQQPSACSFVLTFNSFPSAALCLLSAAFLQQLCAYFQQPSFISLSLSSKKLPYAVFCFPLTYLSVFLLRHSTAADAAANAAAAMSIQRIILLSSPVLGDFWSSPLVVGWVGSSLAFSMVN